MAPFNIFAKRSLRKRELYDPVRPELEQTVEIYLQGLDQYRFTTASPPLPLPLRALADDKDMDAADAIHQLLSLADADRSSMPRILPILTTENEPIYRVVRQYRSVFGGPIQDTLVILLPLDKATGPQMSWDQSVRDIKTRLNALTRFSFETDIPHNIARFDVEIRDDDRCFNPWREIFTPGDDLSMRYEDWARVFYSGEQALREFLKDSLNDSFLDVSLELQRDISKTSEQIAIVIEVVPCTQYGWARLRGRVLDLLQNFSAGIKGLVPPLFEVEFIPVYETESAKVRKEVELKAIMKKAPDLLIYGSGVAGEAQTFYRTGNDSNASFERQKREAHHSHDPLKTDKRESRDSAYITGPQPSPVKPMFHEHGRPSSRPEEAARHRIQDNTRSCSQNYDGVFDSSHPTPPISTPQNLTVEAISAQNASSPNSMPQGLSIKRTTSYGALLQSPTTLPTNAPASASAACDTRAPLPPSDKNVDNWLEQTRASDLEWPIPSSEKETSIVTNEYAEIENSSLNKQPAHPSSAVCSSDVVPSESASRRKMTLSSDTDFLLAKRYSENRLEGDPTSKELGFNVTPTCNSHGSPVQSSNVAPLHPFAVEPDSQINVGNRNLEEQSRVSAQDGEMCDTKLLEESFGHLTPGELTSQLDLSSGTQQDTEQECSESQTPLMPSTPNRLSGTEKVKNMAKDLKNALRSRKSRLSWYSNSGA